MGQWLSPRSNVKFKKNPFDWIKLKMDITSLPQIDFSINAQKSWSAWNCKPLENIGWNGDESIIFKSL